MAEDREKNVSLFASNSAISDNRKLAIDLEKGIYNYAIQFAKEHNITRSWDNPLFREAYLAKARSVYFNIVKNPSLFQQVGYPHELAFLRPEALNSEKWFDIIESYNKKKDGHKAAAIQITDMFTCGKCKGKRCSYYEAQTRSSDEAVTVFLTCMNCNHRWKM